MRIIGLVFWALTTMGALRCYYICMELQDFSIKLQLNRAESLSMQFNSFPATKHPPQQMNKYGECPFQMPHFQDIDRTLAILKISKMAGDGMVPKHFNPFPLILAFRK